MMLMMGGLFYRSLALDSSVTILPSPPENAVATQLNATQVQLTWDASPTLSSSIYSYTVYYKLKTDPNYPAFPQITRTDSLASYSETITVLADEGYDFKVYANTASGLKSADGCASCEASNAVCGNAIIEPGEACEGVDLQGAMCTDFGYLGGTLGCSASCQYQFSSCIAPHSGGGGGPQFDVIKPIVGTLTAPKYANQGPIIVNYQGVSDAGGSGLDYVKFYYRKGVDPWIDSGLLSDQESGTFEFYPPNDLPDTYYFALQAYDNQGNSSAFPTYSSQASTIYDNAPPTIETIDIPQTVNGPLTLTYEGAIDASITALDHVELWFKKGQDGSWTNSLLTNTQENGQFVFDAFSDSDTYYFDLVAVDLAGNRSLEKGESQIGVVYDVDPPLYSSLKTLGVNDGKTIIIHYEGATDVGLAGLAEAELWYKKDVDGVWTATGLIGTEVNGDFNFTLADGEGTYYFALVLKDNFGNLSALPKAEGALSVVLGLPPLEVVLVNLPKAVTEVNSTNISVTGKNIVSYRYQINNGPYSLETPIEYPIQLQNLPEGDYQLNVIVKDINGFWQDPDEATSYQWSIAYQTPGFVVVGPYTDENQPNQVMYMVLYEGDEVVDLKQEDLSLNKTETADGQLILIQQGENLWQVNLVDLTGEGELFFTISDALKDTQGNALPQTISPIYLLNIKKPEEVKTEPQKFPELLENISPPITPPVPDEAPDQQTLIESAIESIKKYPRVPVVTETPPGVSTKATFEAQQGDCKAVYPQLDFEDSALDSDNDGLSNRTECYLGTDPTNPDTDGDECGDGDEVNWLSLNPNEKDCPFASGQGVVWITSPQNNWVISRLEVMGLTPDNTSTVSLFAFPVTNDITDLNAVIPLGKVDQFTPASIDHHYFFGINPMVDLKEGQKYELLAVSVLSGGQVVSSAPVRFIYDAVGIKPPVPLTIGDRSIPKGLKLTNVHISQSDNGKVRVTGNSEYGAQVFAMWQSIVLASSVITDSQLGYFSIESPMPLDPDQFHKVTLYALKQKDEQLLRSPNVEVKFYLHLLRWIYYLFIIILLRIIILFVIRKLQKNEKTLTKDKK